MPKKAIYNPIKMEEELNFEDREETVYATYNVNIRKEPNIDAEIVGLLPGDKDIKRIGYSEE